MRGTKPLIVLAIMLVLIAAIVWLGLYPQPVLDTAAGALQTLQQQADVSIRTAGSSRGANIAWQPLRDLWAVHPEPYDGGVP